MKSRDISAQLERIALAQDFAGESAKLAEAWRAAGLGIEGVEPVLRFIEGHPGIDYGMPGALVHFVETFYGKGYEALLLDSVERKPTATTVWMLNRVLNGTKAQAVRARYVAAMEAARSNPRADPNAQPLATQFLDRIAHG
jgi:hypothetical protein